MLGEDTLFERQLKDFQEIEDDPNKNVDEAKLNEGEFSWHAGDTGQPIYSTEGHQETVWMLDDKGNKYQEDAYEGYGVFGGKDFYILLGEMNGLELSGAQTSSDEKFYDDRGIAIKFAFKDGSDDDVPGVKYPRFTTDESIPYEKLPNPRSHENQGWFEEEGRDEHDFGDDDFDESKTDEQEEVKEQEKLTTQLVMQIANSAAAASPGQVRISDITREVSREVLSVDYEEVSKFVRNTLAVEGWDVAPMESKTNEQDEVKEQKEIPIGWDIHGNEITKGDEVATSDANPIRGTVSAVWDDGSVDIEYTSGPGGPLADTFDIKGHGVQKLDTDTDESKVNEATVGCPNCGGELDVVSDDLRDEWERIDYYCPKCKRDFSRKIEFDQAGMTTSDEWDDEEGEPVDETKTNEEEIGEGNKVDTVSNDPSFERAVEKFAQIESDENKNVAEDVQVEEDLFDEPEFPPSADAVGGLKRYVVTVHADDIVAIVLAEDEDAAVDKYLDDDIEEWLEPVSQPMFTAKLESEVAEKKVDEATRLPPQTVDRMEGLIDRSYMDDLRKVVQAVSATLLEDGFEEEEVMIFLADQVEGGILGALDNSKGKASAGQPEGEEESVEVDPSVEYKDPGEYRESKTNEDEVKESYGNVYIKADIEKGLSKEEIIKKIQDRYPDIGDEQAAEIYDGVVSGKGGGWGNNLG